jgi:WD40 repeat protein
VFYYLTYEGAVDMDAIEDEGQRRATEAQINNFGQTPSQLIKKKAHAKRNANDFVAVRSIFATPKQLQAYFLQVASSPLAYIGIPETNLPTLLYLGVTDRIITVDQERTPASHRWLPTTPNAQISPFTFEPDPLLSTKRKIGIPYSSEVNISPLCFDVTNDGRVLLSCGHWDNSFKMSYVDTAKQIQSIVKHKDIVTCLALGTDGKTLITGSKDTTLMVWDLQMLKNNNYKVDEKPIHILYGHDDEITSVAINIELDIAVSGSKDGTCILHTLRRGKYVRTIYHPKRFPIRLLVISNQGHIVLYSQEDLMINLYTINARFITSVELSERLNHMMVTRNGEYLITGSEKGTVVIRKLFK